MNGRRHADVMAASAQLVAGPFGPFVVKVADCGKLRTVVAEIGPRVKMVPRAEATRDHSDPDVWEALQLVLTGSKRDLGGLLSCSTTQAQKSQARYCRRTLMPQPANEAWQPI